MEEKHGTRWSEKDYARMYTAMVQSAQRLDVPVPVFKSGKRREMGSEFWKDVAAQVGRTWKGCRSKWVHENGRVPVAEVPSAQEQLALSFQPKGATPRGRAALEATAALATSETELTAENRRLRRELDEAKRQLRDRNVTPIEAARPLDEQVVADYNRMATAAPTCRCRGSSDALKKRMRRLSRALPAFKKIDAYRELFKKVASIPCLTRKFMTRHGDDNHLEFFKTTLFWCIENPRRVENILGGMYDHVREGDRFPGAPPVRVKGPKAAILL